MKNKKLIESKSIKQRKTEVKKWKIDLKNNREEEKSFKKRKKQR